MGKIDKKKVGKAKLTYQEMRDLASAHDLEVRCRLAERLDLEPEILYFLAEDSAIEVRRRIALNPTTPRQADLLLARDSDEEVRVDLTEKIGKLAPNITAEERDKIKALTYDALTLLSRDQATRVRQILAETLKDIADAPNDVINHLARDMELVVAGPVLQFSPVLSDDDLLEIISSSHAQGALNAISKRERVSEVISDAVIAKNDESAIADLLANHSAQIREDTLDMLVAQAEKVQSWHAPLVKRPTLSARAASRMAHYLADNLLDVLKAREDLPEDVIFTIKQHVKQRIDQSDELDENAEQDLEPETDPVEIVRDLQEKGKLSEDNLIDWMDEGKWLHVTSALALMSQIPRVIVKKITTSQSAKGMMALCWKAGVSAELGESLQFKLAKIPIGNILKADQKGGYPLTDEELNWHLDLFGGR